MNENNILKRIMSFLLIYILINIGFAGILIFSDLIDFYGVEGATIIVDINGQGNYIRIQDAINNASKGDTIHVWDGIYNEKILINKSITLIGTSAINTFIIGNGFGDVIHITSNWVNISGLTITGSGNESGYQIWDAGIELHRVENVTIREVNCSNNYYGIYLFNSFSNKIMDNKFYQNINSGVTSFISSLNIIINNSFELNDWFGINLDHGCDSNIIYNNFCSQSSIGILIDHCEINIISQNTCFNNEYGYKIWGSFNNTFYSNFILENNNTGVLLQYGSKDNYIYHNSFVNNKIQAIDQPFNEGRNRVTNNIWNNSVKEGNYWSDYSGIDINGDGIGDTDLPHLGLDNYPLMNPIKWNKLPWKLDLNKPTYINENGNFILTWSKCYDIEGYILQEDSNNLFDSPTNIYQGKNLQFNLYNKENGTYYYRVQTYNDYGESNWSNIVKVTIDWLPDIPKNFKVENYPNGNGLNLSWNRNKRDTKEYNLFSNLTGTWKIIASIPHPINSYNHTNLINGKIYFYKICSKDFINQTSNFSNVINRIPQDLKSPKPPIGLKIKSILNDSIKIEWMPNTENDIEGYNIYRSIINNPVHWGEPIGNNSKFNLNYTDKNLNESSTYYYVITAFDEVPNESSFSEVVIGTTFFTLYPPEINNSIKDFKINEDSYDDSTVNLYYLFKDRNNDVLYFWSEGQKHINVTIFQENGSVLLVPEKNWNGQETLTFFASDGIWSIFDNITITITPLNDPPEFIEIISPKECQQFLNTTPINFMGSCFDPDLIYGDILEYKWFSNLSGEIGIGYNLSEIFLSTGNHTIIFLVTDSENLNISTKVNISILESNKPDEDDLNQPESFSISLISIYFIIIIIIIIILFLIVINKKYQIWNRINKQESKEPEIPINLDRRSIKSDGEIIIDKENGSLSKSEEKD